MQLAQTQQLFWSVIAERRSVTHAELGAVFVGTTELSVVERLEIYASMYVHRLVDALGAEFPGVRERLGEEAFFATAEAYIRAFPSEHPSIAHVGRHLPRYLRRIGRRDLASLAALERARSLVFDAIDEVPLTAADLARVAPERLADVVLIPVKALALVRQRALFRRGFAVHEARLSRLEARALRAMLAGATLGAICELFSAEPEPVAAAFSVVARWLASGWIAMLQCAA